jgi:hypothetical protein
MAAVKAILLLLALLAAAAWFVFSGSGAVTERDALAPHAAVPGRLEAGTRGTGAADGILRTELTVTPAGTGDSSERAADAQNDASPVAWFRGQLRIISGELPLPPLLNAVTFPAGTSSRENSTVRLAPGELSFEIPTHSESSRCELTLPEILRVVRVHGHATGSNDVIYFDTPADGVIVEVEVKPHAGVLFLHDPSGEPLAFASGQHKVQGNGGSSTYSSTLGEDGLMIFDFKRLEDVGDAETVSFAVCRPPDIGYSESPEYPVAEFLLMSRPIVLRFGATERLRFRALDLARRPLTGATVRLGNGSISAPSLADGWIEALQSSPASENVVALAPGHIEATFPLTAAALSGQDLELWPASRLVLAGQEMPSSGWSDLDAEITFDGKEDVTTLAQNRFRAGRIVECAGSTTTSTSADRGWYQLKTSFSHEGRVVVDGIHADVPAHVSVTYRGFVVLDERVPIRPGDGEHRVQVGPLPEVVPLIGSVENFSGAPLAGVAVSASGSSWSHMIESGADGRFDLGVVAVGSVTRIRVSATGFAPIEVEHVAEAADTDSVGTLTLAPGRSVLVIILAPDGTPFVPLPDTVGATWYPAIEVFGEQVKPVEAPSTPSSEGNWLFADLPLGRFVVFVAPFDEDDGHAVDTTLSRTEVTLTEIEFEWLNASQ